MFISDGRVEFVTVALFLHICADRRGYKVTWEGRPEDVTKRVIAYLEPRGMTHAWEEIGERGSVPATMTELLAWMYPTCEHGLGLRECYGPQHWYMTDEERYYAGC